MAGRKALTGNGHAGSQGHPRDVHEGHAPRLEATPAGLHRAVSTLGEHTALVRREVLGLPEAGIA
jgi:crotonobetainyl-CoA:carnitine CoA-transferase CaiB-like acyl-CoA transferase